MSQLTWKHVVVIGMFIAGVVALSAIGRDTNGLTTIIMAIISAISGYGVATMRAIRDNVNGNMSKALDMAADKTRTPDPKP